MKDGDLIVEAPSRDTDWWEVISYEASITLKDWSVTDGIYTGTVGALFSQGSGYVILGEYNDPDISLRFPRIITLLKADFRLKYICT